MSFLALDEVHGVAEASQEETKNGEQHYKDQLKRLTTSIAASPKAETSLNVSFQTTLGRAAPTTKILSLIIYRNQLQKSKRRRLLSACFWGFLSTNRTHNVKNVVNFRWPHIFQSVMNCPVHLFWKSNFHSCVYGGVEVLDGIGMFFVCAVSVCVAVVVALVDGARGFLFHQQKKKVEIASLTATNAKIANKNSPPNPPKNHHQTLQTHLKTTTKSTFWLSQKCSPCETGDFLNQKGLKKWQVGQNCEGQSLDGHFSFYQLFVCFCFGIAFSKDQPPEVVLFCFKAAVASRIWSRSLRRGRPAGECWVAGVGTSCLLRWLLCFAFLAVLFFFPGWLVWVCFLMRFSVGFSWMVSFILKAGACLVSSFVVVGCSNPQNSHIVTLGCFSSNLILTCLPLWMSDRSIWKWICWWFFKLHLLQWLLVDSLVLLWICPVGYDCFIVPASFDGKCVYSCVTHFDVCNVFLLHRFIFWNFTPNSYFTPTKLSSPNTIGSERNQQLFF